MARAAARLVRVERADDDRLAVRRRGEAVHEALRHRRRTAAAVADGLELVHELGPGEQLGHGAERKPAKVLVEPGDDDALAALDQPLDHADDLEVEELHLVDPDGVVAVREADDLLRARDRDSAHLRARVADDVADVVAVVDARLRDERALAGDLRAAEPPDELVALAAEHRAADDLEPASALGKQPDHAGDPSARTGRNPRTPTERATAG